MSKGLLEVGTIRAMAGLASLAVVFASATADAQTPPAPLDVVGHVGGAPSDAAVVGQLAYVLTGYALDVYDLSEPPPLSPVGSLPRRGVTPGGGGSRSQRLGVAGDRALIVDRNMVRIVDLAVPAAPIELGVYRLPQTGIDDAVANETHMYVAAGTGSGVMVVDISTPASPRLVGWTADGQYSRLALAGGCLFAVGQQPLDPPYERGLRVYDVGVPESPAALSWTEGVTAPYDMVVGDNRLYTAGNGGVRIYSVADPTDVRHVGDIGIGDAVDAVDVVGTLAHVHGGGALRVYDVADPGAPVLRDSQEVAGPQRRSRSAGETRVAAGAGVAVVAEPVAGISVFSVSGEGRLSARSVVRSQLRGWVHAVEADEGRAWALADGSLFGLDVSNPANPLTCAVHPPPTGRAFAELASNDDKLCILARVEPERLELHVLDTAIAGCAPQTRSVVDLGGGWPEAVAMAGDFAYVGSTHRDDATPANYTWRLRVFDVTDANSPRPVGDLELPRPWSEDWGDPALAVLGGRVLAGSYDGLCVADFSDPTRPFVAGRLQTSYQIQVDAVAGSAQRAYLAIRSTRVGDLDNLAVVDLADPARPAIVARQAARYAPTSLALGAVHLFAGSLEGVQMFALGGSAGPAAVRSASLASWARDIALRDGYAYVAAHDAGLFVLYTGEPDLPPVTPPTAPPMPSSLPPTLAPPGTPTATTATPVPTRTTPVGPSPTGAGDCVCRALNRRVPPAAIADAVANPDSYQGWRRPSNPNAPVGPANPLRTCLTLQRLAVPYHPLWNPVVWRAGCH